MSRKRDKFVRICKMTQPKLKKYVCEMLRENGYIPVCEDGYVYAEGDIPVLLTAHLDTVHKQSVKRVKVKDGVLSSPQGIGGDDRCGVFIIRDIVCNTDLRPSILFCEDEEVGGVGSDKFCMSPYIDDLKEMKFLVELDRANASDAVFYSCGNSDFINWIQSETGYREAWGTFSDISILSPECDVASVNLSCGYYNAHRTDEYVVFDEMMHTVKVVRELLEVAKGDDVPQFVYMKVRGFDRFDGMFETEDCWVFVFDRDGEEVEILIEASDEYEAVARFFYENPTVCMNDIVTFYHDYGYADEYDDKLWKYVY